MYVMTILMLLSALTYARLESFRSFAGLEASFNHFMTSTERLPLDRMNEKMYDDIKVLSKAGGAKEAPNTASSRLSFHVIMRKETREKNPEAYRQMRELAKLLMTNLYGGQRFFKEMADKRSTFLDEILNEVQQASDNQESLRLKNANVLSKLQFSNPELQYIFFLMLHGLPNNTEKPLVEARPIDTFEIIPAKETTSLEDENAAKAESEEAKAPPGYASLVDFITVKPTTKIRVFLASKELLTAIYGNPDIANTIIETRGELYNQVQAQKLTIAQATEQFKNSYSQSGNAHLFPDILDFSVTNTNPKKYE